MGFLEEAEQALGQAQPQEVNAHRGLLAEALQMVEQQGGSAQQVTQQAGAGTSDPSQMSHSDLISTTLALARSHPQIVEAVAQRYPQAQGLINAVLGGAGGNAGNAGGGLLGGLLGG